ncbi:MAG: HD-GYP domain-containing protein [Armatimonadetes bacterium]|nr:HD-GYP domain-containing protein [Armatimonadota bacterium]
MGIERTDRGGVQRVYEQTVEALVAAVGQRDKTAEGHSLRVTRYCTAIGKVVGLSEPDLIDLKHAAGLHDIGKVAVSRKILNKLGKLTEDEFAVMKRHSTVAIRILEKVDGLQCAVPLVKHHHERFDGKGYPDGLAGDDIPLGARIIAVAEAFDILTSDVPWRDAMDQESAIAELETCSGTQFDPNIVTAFRTAITSGLVER